MDGLNKWLTLIANLGVVAGLIFLGIQVSQTNTLMQATTYQQRSNDLITLAYMEAESDALLNAISKSQFREFLCRADEMDLAELTPQEFAAMQAYLRAQLFRLQNLDQQHRHGLLDDAYHASAVIGTMQMFLPIWRRFDVPQIALAQQFLDTYEHPIPERCRDGMPSFDPPEETGRF